MKSKIFKTKTEAIDFIKKSGGYYETTIDDRFCPTYIVFYK